MKYRITYYDPERWISEDMVQLAKTKKEALKLAKEMLYVYPPLYHSCFIRIEKVELVELIDLNKGEM